MAAKVQEKQEVEYGKVVITDFKQAKQTRIQLKNKGFNLINGGSVLNIAEGKHPAIYTGSVSTVSYLCKKENSPFKGQVFSSQKAIFLIEGKSIGVTLSDYDFEVLESAQKGKVFDIVVSKNDEGYYNALIAHSTEKSEKKSKELQKDSNPMSTND